MKNVLIIDAPPIFREFLKDKLSEEKINVVTVQEKRDSLIKVTSLLPDLVIVDINEFDDDVSLTELFQKFKSDPNASRIPLIATGPTIDKTAMETYAKLGVHKYFVKPLKIDVLFEAIGKILHTAFSLDTTPCILDVHRNNNIIFIEIAQGLNREKISLLKYKVSEIIESNELEQPKVILMMTNLELSFIDGVNLELLIDNILANSKIHTKDVKILSFSNFTKQLVEGHPQYDGIEVATDISQFLNELVDSTRTSRVSDLITDQILASSDSADEGSIEMRFSTDAITESQPLQDEQNVEQKNVAGTAETANVASASGANVAQSAQNISQSAQAQNQPQMQMQQAQQPQNRTFVQAQSQMQGVAMQVQPQNVAMQNVQNVQMPKVQSMEEKERQAERQLPTIAVVDDDQVTLKLCAAAFTQIGYRVDLFSSGIDFLANMGKKRYAAIILDILMPGVSGFDTLKRLQGLPNKPPIIIYSQAIRKEIVVQALSLGAKSFIVKPQKPEVLANKVQEVLLANG